MTDVTPRTRRKRGWIVASAIVIVLVVLLVAAELIARTLTPRIIADQVRSSLELAEDQEIDVTVGGGLVLPQLIVGSFAQLDLDAPDLTIGDVTVAHVHATVRDIAMSGSMSGANLDAEFTPEQIRALIPDGAVSVDTVSFADGTATVGTRVAGLDVSLTVTPGVADEGLSLTPVSAKIGSLEVTADALSTALGGVLAGLVQPIPVCLADSIPQGVHLTNIAVTDDVLTASAELDEGIITNPEMWEPAGCS